jgi:hypothetical protein
VGQLAAGLPYLIATVATMKTSTFTSWEPRPGWLILLPSREASQRNGLYIPESSTKKPNSGICIMAFDKTDEELFLNKECLFPTHSEYAVSDTDTGWLLYIIEANKVILTRQPPNDIARFSREKGEGMSFATLTHDKT